ncbi:response regulator [Thiocystis violacea]|uniref:response regulator n=1 Tax=Thiocystis violacea TaxID=13725 RepID=UPI001906C084|nr:response regulator [Thiocystis violacea]MBK1718166.1 hypothetical protein [Thiocystis violacea]
MDKKHEKALLIVEDSDEDYELTRWALRRVGFKRPIQRFTRVDDTLEFLFPLDRTAHRALAPPALALLDVNLPDGTGREILEAIRCDPRCPPFPIVMLTTSNNPRDVELYYRLGAAGYLIKPLSRELFASRIDAFVSYWFMAATLP